MASRTEHEAQAHRNQVLAERLASEGDYEWAVTTLFYAALHLLQAYAESAGTDISTHAERGRWLRRSSELHAVLGPYRVLRSRSQDARYECRRFSREQFGDLHSHEFARIVQHMSTLLRR
jgi:hypothetical protein